MYPRDEAVEMTEKNQRRRHEGDQARSERKNPGKESRADESGSSSRSSTTPRTREKEAKLRRTNEAASGRR